MSTTDADVWIEQRPAHDRQLRAAVAAAVDELHRRYADDTPYSLPPDAVRFLALVDDVPVGCAALVEVGAGLGELKRLWVDPVARGRGVASRLVAAVEAQARAQGMGRLRLETGTRQPEAIELYRKLGWEPIEPYGPFATSPLVRCFGRELTG